MPVIPLHPSQCGLRSSALHSHHHDVLPDFKPKAIDSNLDWGLWSLSLSRPVRFFFLNKCFITATVTDENIDADGMSKLHGWKEHGEPAQWYTYLIPTFRILTLKKAGLHNEIQTKDSIIKKRTQSTFIKNMNCQRFYGPWIWAMFNPLVVLRISPMATTSH